MNDVIYDVETYPNCFTLAAEHAYLPIKWSFEISDYRDDSTAIVAWCRELGGERIRMVGFNNLGFDYPVLHTLLRAGRLTAKQLYDKAMSIIRGQDEDRFASMIYPSDRMVDQLDLYKIHHFDNKAKATGLKALEFAMRSENVSDLPFPVGTILNREQVALLKEYNAHDVSETKKFYHKSLEQIRFREELTRKHSRDFLNHNDTKIGAEIFQMELEKSGVQCYEYGPNGRQPRQTKREFINLHECVPGWISFTHPEFQRIQGWLSSQVITETKGVFKDIIAHIDGLDFVYGTGGLHASVENKMFIADEQTMILDMDVTSLYPSIAIEHGHYPQHLGQKFVEVYRNLRQQRVSYKKGTAENAMLKLALNGVYGKSNDKFSIFYDPLFTMKITIGGQMMISLLAERLMGVSSLKIIQVNTDGITVIIPRTIKSQVESVCQQWEKETRLTLEYAEYSKMAVRDVNNYIAVKSDGSVKRKGTYEWDREWHQDNSALVVPKVAEQYILHQVDIADTVRNWPDKMDFYHRIKVPRNSELFLLDEHGQHKLQNTTRYYVAKDGGRLAKVMPPLKGNTEKRWFAIESGWNVCICNDVKDAVLPIDYDYYITEVKKLTEIFHA